MQRRARLIAVAIPLGLAILGAACAAPPGVGVGERLFVSKGCASCHGQKGEGADTAPALPGHTAAEVRRQVRGPVGAMPAFGRDQITDQELEQIAAYITSLPGAPGHREPTQMGDMVAMHHWMAILALKAGNTGDAEHHIRHVMDSVGGEHKRRMEEALSMARGGRAHEAEHEIEHMLAGAAMPHLGLPQLHLRASLSAIAVGDRADAEHHIQHFWEGASAPERQKAETILGLLRRDELHQAQHEIEELLPRR